jgi:hypothetical protein
MNNAVSITRFGEGIDCQENANRDCAGPNGIGCETIRSLRAKQNLDDCLGGAARHTASEYRCAAQQSATILLDVGQARVLNSGSTLSIMPGGGGTVNYLVPEREMFAY